MKCSFKKKYIFNHCTIYLYENQSVNMLPKTSILALNNKPTNSVRDILTALTKITCKGWELYRNSSLVNWSKSSSSWFRRKRISKSFNEANISVRTKLVLQNVKRIKVAGRQFFSSLSLFWSYVRFECWNIYFCIEQFYIIIILHLYTFHSWTWALWLRTARSNVGAG